LIKTLYAKLALTLIVLLFVTAIVYAAISYYLTRANIISEVQRENAEIASSLSNEITQTVSGAVDGHFVERLFRTMSTVNPDVHLYLLNPQGKIITRSAANQPQMLGVIDLEPLDRFLSPDRSFPIFAQDPLAEDSLVTFSVAEIKNGEEKLGYLYVTLNAPTDDGDGRPGRLISTIGISALLGSLLVSLLAGLYIFRRITARLQLLSSEIEAFRESGFRSNNSYRDLAQDDSDDEISRLGTNYDEMANRIVDQIQLLEEADKNRRAFIANVSHDLRTPLAATQGYIELMLHKNERCSVEQREEYLGIALKHSNRLKVLISELFELAKLEDRSERIELEPLSLSEVIGDVHQGCLPEAEQKNITLTCLGIDKSHQVTGDIALLDRAISNLMVNAIQYTPENGTVTVTVESDDENKKVKVCVEDNGPGIEPEEINKIFKRFHRADNEHNEKGNAGLGLAITQRIVVLHGDMLAVENTGEGTRFSFSLSMV